MINARGLDLLRTQVRQENERHNIERAYAKKKFNINARAARIVLFIFFLSRIALK
jgi:hypothetical protein